MVASSRHELYSSRQFEICLTPETKPGKTWEKDSKRAGKLKFSESVTEFRDQNGELVVTAIGVGVQTEKPVEN